MARRWGGWYWYLGIASWLAMGGAIAADNDCALAQIKPDGTLPNNSIVTPQGNTSRISGGTKAGSNVFHSFEEFSVPTGGTAYFNNALDIQNIISRVTGSSISNIDGLLRANGTANLFLLNPNGIIFGPNASLSIGGSFLASTASSLNFADGTQFSATAPQTTPLLRVSVPLGLQYGRTNPGSILNQSKVTNSSGETVGLQVQQGETLALVGGDVNLDNGKLTAPGGRIELGGVAGAGTLGLNVDSNNLSLSYPEQVQRASVSLTNGAEADVTADGGGSLAVTARNLALMGGSTLRAGIRQDSGSVGSQAGNVEINATGAVTASGSNIFNTVQSRAIGNSGDINVTTGSLSFTNGAQLGAGTIGRGDAGSVNINARDTVSFDRDSLAFSNVESGAVGNGGDINVTTGSLTLNNGAQLAASTFGHGDAGSVTVTASGPVSFDGVGSNGFFSGAFSNVEEGAMGNGGDINVTARSLYLTNGAALTASTRGRGDAGSVTITAGNISFNGVGSTGFASGAFSTVASTGEGKGGSVNITTGSLSLTNGAVLNAKTFGRGDAGNVNINARELVSFDGVGSNGFFSGAFSTVEEGAVGNGGDITIKSGSLSLSDGAALNASTSGQGDAGSVNINARDTVSFDGKSAAFSFVAKRAVGNGGGINITTGALSVTNGAQLDSSTLGQGDAGSVTILARDTVSFDGVSSDGFNSGAHSTVEPGAVGKGGGINIQTGSLSVKNGASLTTSTSGQGDAGSVNINARDHVSFDGVSSDGLSSKARSTVEPGAVGNAGDINIQTGSLSVKNGAQLQANTVGQGDAGSVNITARDNISFDGGVAFSTVGASNSESRAVGNGGDINIQTGSLSVKNGAQLQANTFGQGDAGSVIINARDNISFDGGVAFSTVEEEAVGNGGDIDITTGSLSVTNSAGLTTSTRGRGDAGSVTITASGPVSFDGVDSTGRNGAFSTVEEGGVGNGGDINIQAESLSLTNGAELTASTQSQGDAGSVFVQADDFVTLANSNIFSNVESTAVGDGGDINVTARSLFLTNGAELAVSTFGQGDAGSVNIKARDNVSFDGGNAFTTVEEEAVGNGGDINITTGSLSVTNSAGLTTSTRGRGDAGSVTITASGPVSFDGVGSTGFVSGAFSTVEEGAVGNGGDINVTARSLSLTNGAVLNASSFGQGDAGSVNIKARDTVSFDGGSAFSVVEPGAEGNGGGINVTTGSLSVTDGAELNASTSGQGDAGNIQVSATDAIELIGTTPDGEFSSSLSTDTNSAGAAGNLTISTGKLSVREGAFVSAVTRPGSQGNGGNLTVRASDAIELSGTTPNGQFSSGLFTDTNGAGAAGDMTIDTGKFIVRDGAEVNVSSEGSGNAGELIVQADNLLLDNQGKLKASTASGEGGSIDLQVSDLTLMRRDSLISAEAGGTGNGGNIKLNAPFIVAVPSENNDIVANAVQGQGGNINIATQGIYGLVYRDRLTVESDITASSEFGVNGVVEINTLDVDPSQGLAALPAELVDASVLIASSRCGVSGRQDESKFIITGRGELPIRPTDAHISYYPTGTVRSIPSSSPSSETPRSSVLGGDPSTNPPTSSNPAPLVEAQGWEINNKGEVVLTAHAPNATPHIPWLPSATCHTP